MPDHPAKLSLETMRFLVSSCRKCSHDKSMDAPTASVFETPRFGTGNRSEPKLMVVGQNPPRDVDRCLHGAWMLHYNTPEYMSKKGPHELLVLELLSYLKVSTADLYATQAVKCPTANNAQIEWGNIRCCNEHLASEIRDVRPMVILAFGTRTRWAVEACFVHSGPIKARKVEPVGQSIEAEVITSDNVIYAPHPSKVGRFIHKASWFKEILASYMEARDQPRRRTRFEELYDNAHLRRD